MTTAAPIMPPGFVFGAATSAYQIEGATGADGRGPGIWDDFAARHGTIRDGDTAEVACDHYRRYSEDVELLAGLGVDAYRFSVSWPRLLPQGIGSPNPRGIAFYDRLIDSLLAAGVEPWLTLYHWDLPSALEDKGGWRNRDVADWLTELAVLAQRHYGDRVKHWIVLNEACMTSHRGHAFGTDAPGLQSHDAFFAVVHHQNLAQGRAAEVLRSLGGPDSRIGTSVLLQPALPLTDDPADCEAARMLDTTWNRAVLDPLLRGTYPDALMPALAPWLHESDLSQINCALDFLGVNYYVRSFVEADPNGVLGLRRARSRAGEPVSPFGMELYPQGLEDVLTDLRINYGNPPTYVTECGYADIGSMQRRQLLEDAGRTDYLGRLLLAVKNANAAGADVRGLFVWSLLDNFEWEFGYWARFGLVHVDYATQRRTPKQSYRWYRSVIEQNRARSRAT